MIKTMLRIREQGLPILFRWFIIYSMIGWFYETMYCFLTSGVFRNRGFLFGPFCPIYGLSMLLMLLICYDSNISFLGLFFKCAFVATAMEFVTSIWMERIFNRRWWDYSNMPLNINGRICLGATLLFGILGAVIIRYVHPAIERFINRVSNETMFIVGRIVLIVFLYDIVLTIQVGIN